MSKSLSQKLKWKLIDFLARRLPPCNLMTELFSEARERPLTLREKVIIKLHFFTCEACHHYSQQIEQMSESLKFQTETKAEVEPQTKLSNEARNRIKAALEAAANGNKN